MKATFVTALSLIATPALAQSAFDGAWKADLKSATYTSAPDVYMLAGGRYGCSTCKPAYSLPADGQFHRVSGHDYFDEMSVTVVNPRTVKLAERKNGKLIYEETDTVSADGHTVMQTSLDMSGTKPISATASETRIGAVPRGVHPINGRWNPKVATQVSSDAMVIKMRVVGDTLSFDTLTGQSYVARFGGPAVPMKGDIGGTMVRLRRLSANAFQVTSMRAGKTVGTATITANGNTLTYQTTSALYGTKSSIKAYRQ
jgi:hypothetical protein